MLDAIVIGGGFAGVTAARELTLAGLDCTLIEARDRLGGRTWYRDWGGDDIEMGGGWVHWHQPHAWAELTRAGQDIGKSDSPELVSWIVEGERRTGTMADRDAIAARAWNRFVEPAAVALPRPHDPLFALQALAPIDAQTIAQRITELDLGTEEHDVLAAELEAGLVHGYLDDAGAVSVLRWHALSGYSLKLTQEAGGVYTFGAGTKGLIDAMAGQAPFARWLSTPVDSIGRVRDGVEVRTRNGDVLRARTCVLTVPLNVLPSIRIDDLSQPKRAAIALGQASRGIKLWLRVRGETRGINAVARAHPFGYLMTHRILPDGSQLLVGFGRDAAAIDAGDRDAVQRGLDELVPGLEIVDVTTHDWLADEFARGTWAIHRPGWYAHHHAAMRTPEQGLVFGGSDLADGWSGFVDGAIESGLRAAHQVQALLRPAS